MSTFFSKTQIFCWTVTICVGINLLKLLTTVQFSRVVIIRSPRASPAFKCERETSSTVSSYNGFSPRFKGGIN